MTDLPDPIDADRLALADDLEALNHLADSMGFGRTHDMLRRVHKSLSALRVPRRAGEAAWDALVNQCASTKDKSQVKTLVTVRKEDVVAALAHREVREEVADIRSPAGTKLRYLGKNGYEPQLKRANEYLKVDAIYTLARSEIHDWHTDFYLVEVPDIPFNSVHFAIPTSPSPSRPAAQPGVREALELAYKWMICDDEFGDPEDFKRDLAIVKSCLAPARANEVKP